MKKILIHSPIGIWHKQSYESILNLNTNGVSVDFLFTVANIEDPKYDEHGIERNPRWSVNLAEKMNKARKICIDNGYDYLFNVEHDIILPEDALLKLMKHAKPNNCVSGVYRARPLRNRRSPVCCKTKDKQWPEWEDVRNKEKVPLWIICFGCILIGKKVLEMIEFDKSIDAGFAVKTDIMGIEKLLIPSVVCGHIDRDGKIVYP